MFSTKRLFGKHFTWRLLPTAVLGLAVVAGLVVARAANSDSRQAKLPAAGPQTKIDKNTRIRESLGKLRSHSKRITVRLIPASNS